METERTFRLDAVAAEQAGRLLEEVALACLALQRRISGHPALELNWMLSVASGKGGLTLKELAVRTGLDKHGCSHLIRTALRDGLIKEELSDVDHRCCLVRAKKAGRARAAKAAAQMGIAVQALPPEEEKRLEKLALQLSLSLASMRGESLCEELGLRRRRRKVHPSQQPGQQALDLSAFMPGSTRQVAEAEDNQEDNSRTGETEKAEAKEPTRA